METVAERAYTHVCRSGATGVAERQHGSAVGQVERLLASRRRMEARLALFARRRLAMCTVRIGGTTLAPVTQHAHNLDAQLRRGARRHVAESTKEAAPMYQMQPDAGLIDEVAPSAKRHEIVTRAWQGCGARAIGSHDVGWLRLALHSTGKYLFL